MEERFINVKCVAEMLSVSVSVVWDYAAKDIIPKPHKFGSSTRWKLSEIQSWISSFSHGEVTNV